MSATIRRTNSVCPMCYRRIDAEVIRKEDGVFLEKSCPEHGFFSLRLSKNVELYSDLDRFYFHLADRNRKPLKIGHYWVAITGECNQNCNYCEYNGGGENGWETMEIGDFEQLFRELKGKRKKVSASGGEPTVNPRLLDFIKMGNKNDNVVDLTTNGLKLADFEFCKRLKEIGLKEVRLSLEGLQEATYTKLGLAWVYSAKMKALENLRKLHISTCLSPTIFRGINEFELKNIIDYALKNDFVRELSVNGFSWVGRGRNIDKNRTIMPDELMDIIFSDMKGVSRESFFLLQKLIYFLLDFLSIRLCLYTQIMILVRGPHRWESVSTYLDSKRLGRLLDRVEKFYYRKSKILRRLVFFTAIVFCLNWHAWRIIIDCFRLLFATFFGINVPRFPQRLLPILLNTSCSTLSIDFAISRNCMTGVVSKEKGKLIYDTSSYALMRKERVKL